MRRKDREMSTDFGKEIIDKASYGILSMVDENCEPYGIPLSIVRDNDFLYFHSALEGRKVNILRTNSIVSIAFVGDVKIPENFTKKELDEMAQDKPKVSSLISSVFTTEFESVIVNGNVNLVEDEEEKIKAMKLICEKYTPSKMEYFNVAISSGLKLTNIYRINIINITAKRKKYDLNGKEMKFARME